ncbi:MAG: NADP-dependent oxidoreductase [Pseudomonadales bacterium]|nr:NADP-dependent oxidoreductase [Pseudomonadales bacterium]
MALNRQVLLAARPQGPVTEACFALRDVPVPAPGPGAVLVRNLFLSCDPYMRGRMAAPTGYAGAFALGEPIPARVVGQVLESRHAAFAPGDYVWGFMCWEQYSLVEYPSALYRIDPSLGPVSHAISVLGMPGRTAEVGMLELGRPQPGETVFVSAASGAVGQIAGQLARAAGARVIGSAGTDAKVAHVLERLGFDAAFNYRTETSPGVALDRLCPDGIDVYFDNVGGATLDAVLARLRPFARIPVCGMISQYDGATGGLRNLGAIVGARATLTGFIIYDHMDGFDEFPARMAERMRRGEVRYFEDIVEGIDNTPAAFIGMMAGENLGKRLVQVAPV